MDIPDKVEELRELARKSLEYGDRRFDILALSISGAGIYICLESLKYSLDNKNIENICLLKTAILLFAIALLSNFFAQVVLKKSSLLAIGISKMYKKASKTFTSKEAAKKYEMRGLNTKINITKIYSICLMILNVLTILTIILGIVFLVVFMWKIDKGI